MKHIFIIIFILITSNTISQENKSIIIDKMKYDVAYLASDKLRGRKTGTCGEKKLVY